MNKRAKGVMFGIVAGMCALYASGATAQEAPVIREATEVKAASKSRFDFEIDPLAYALDGYSLHVGAGWGRYRFDVGNFALGLPQWLHGQEDFDASFGGFGVKLDAFLNDEQQLGAFLGLESSYTVIRVEDERSGQSDSARTISAGARVGYRFELPANLYVSPWVGFGYRFGGLPVAGGRTFEMSPWAVFPTIHIGYRVK